MPDDDTLPVPTVNRRLKSSEAHDLAVLVKDRARVLKAHADAQAAAHIAEFEKQMAAEYQWDDDEVWKEAAERCQDAVRAARDVIEKRCRELGIPQAFAPQVGMSWIGRGENLLTQRRAELRRVAKSEIEARKQAATAQIERHAVELRTQILSQAIVTDEARMFLETLAPITDAMKALDFKEIAKKLEADKGRMRQITHTYGLEMP